MNFVRILLPRESHKQGKTLQLRIYKLSNINPQNIQTKVYELHIGNLATADEKSPDKSLLNTNFSFPAKFFSLM